MIHKRHLEKETGMFNTRGARSVAFSPGVIELSGKAKKTPLMNASPLSLLAASEWEDLWHPGCWKCCFLLGGDRIEWQGKENSH